MALALVLLSPPALSCPVCRTDAGAQVRAEIFGPRFWPRLLVAAAPFPVLLGAALVVYHWRPRTPLHGGRHP